MKRKFVKEDNLLERTRTYLVGHMQYVNGRNWREGATKRLTKIGIKVFNPYDKPFLKDVDEDDAVRKEMLEMMEKGYYDEATKRMRTVRSYDLNLVDRSDFIIAHLIPEVASWGSAEEIVTAVRMKKPIFVSMEGGKEKTPLWMLAMFPHKYIYNSIEEVLDMIEMIDAGNKEIDSDRWRLLKKEYR
jgi:hypothetical protein